MAQKTADKRDKRDSRDPRAAEAFSLIKEGRLPEARRALEAVVADDLADAAVLEGLGDVREELGDKSGALDAYQGAVIHLRARDDLDNCKRVLELMLVVDEENRWALRQLADLLLDLGQPDDARAVAQKLRAVQATRRPPADQSDASDDTDDGAADDDDDGGPTDLDG